MERLKKKEFLAEFEYLNFPAIEYFPISSCIIFEKTIIN